MQQPVLHGSRLILRPFVSSDAATVERLAGAREVADTTLSIPHPYLPGAATAWIESHAVQWAKRRSVAYAIMLQSTDELVGAISLVVVPDHAQAEIGYWIGEDIGHHAILATDGDESPDSEPPSLRRVT